jgi:hypothetical protein
MSGWWNRLSSFTRVVAYAVAAVLVFGLAAGIGVVAALMVSGNASPPTGEKVRPEASSPTGGHKEPAQPEQVDTESTQQQYADDKRGQAAPQDGQTAYVDEVGEIQAESVDTFSDSHELLLRYDALTAGDVEKMRADQATLKRAADPIEATQADFDLYDRLVDEAAADLQRSNEILGRNYKTIEGVKGVGPSQ